MPEHGHKDKHEIHRRLVDRLRQQADDIRRLTVGLDEEMLAKRPVPEQWCLKELVCHLHRVQEVFAARVEAMLAQDNPRITRYEPEGDTEFEKIVAKPGKDALVSFLENRERLLGRLTELTPAEWHRRGTHVEFPNYDVHFQVEYMMHHEAHHIYQIFQRRIPLGKTPH